MKTKKQILKIIDERIEYLEKLEVMFFTDKYSVAIQELIRIYETIFTNRQKPQAHLQRIKAKVYARV